VAPRERVHFRLTHVAIPLPPEAQVCDCRGAYLRTKRIDTRENPCWSAGPSANAGQPVVRRRRLGPALRGTDINYHWRFRITWTCQWSSPRRPLHIVRRVATIPDTITRPSEFFGPGAMSLEGGNQLCFSYASDAAFTRSIEFQYRLIYGKLQ
jgi:hypothetical protein